MAENGSKLPLERWLFERIVNARSLSDLMYVGNAIMDLKIPYGHYNIMEAWRKKWLVFFRTGEVGRAENWLYYQVMHDLRKEKAERDERLGTKLDRYQKSVEELGRIARHH